jgi:hypothetical protein
MFDKNVFFQRQIEECRELLRHAVTDADRAFWLQVAERWEGLFKQIKETVPRKKSENAAKAPLWSNPGRRAFLSARSIVAGARRVFALVKIQRGLVWRI